MPELPEVETTLRGIAPHLKGQTIEKIILRRTDLRWPISPEIAHLNGCRITALSRRGKYILIHLGRGTLLLHLGMSGSIRITDLDSPIKKHDHVDILLRNNKIMRFNDPRRFGSLLWTLDPKTHPLLINLGPEPLSTALTHEYLYQISRNRKSNIKSILMNSHIVVGVGNIYANEALFLSKIHPKRAADRISKHRYQNLVTHIKSVLVSAIEQGGTTLKDFTQSNGNPGYFKQSLLVYGRGGKPCINCLTPLTEIKLNQRTTIYCPHCQH